MVLFNTSNIKIVFYEMIYCLIFNKKLLKINMIKQFIFKSLNYIQFIRTNSSSYHQDYTTLDLENDVILNMYSITLFYHMIWSNCVFKIYLLYC